MRLSPCVLHLLALMMCAPAPLALAEPPPSATLPKRSGQARLNDSLEVKLLGSWVLEKATTPGRPSGIGTRMQTYADGRWEITQRDPKTSQIVFTHGGSYRVEGDILIKKVEFAGASTKNRIGQVSRFKIIVDKDTYTQIAVDNQFNEVWKRVDDV